MKLVVHTDGGSRGNPGPAAIGVVIENNEGKVLMEFGNRIEPTTNNIAEYTAVIEALKAIKDKVGETSEINFYLDSLLVVNQLNGIFKIKDPRLREFVTDIRILEQEIGGVVHYISVPREQNRQADFLVNTALGV